MTNDWNDGFIVGASNHISESIYASSGTIPSNRVAAVDTRGNWIPIDDNSKRLDEIERKLDLLIKMIDLQMSAKDLAVLDELTNSK